MSPLQQNLDAVDAEQNDLSEMRRVSLALAFSPARHRRREKMNAAAKWFKSRLGIHGRRFSRSY
jgi:transposase